MIRTITPLDWAKPCLGAQVVVLPEYQAWMQGFPQGSKHILAAAWNGCPVLESSAELQARSLLPETASP